MKDTFHAELHSNRTADVIMQDILDMERVVSWFPILSNVREHEPLQRYTAVLDERLGALTMRADMEIRVTAGENDIKVSAWGRDRQVGSRLSVEGSLHIASIDEGSRVAVDAVYQISGKAAALGTRSIRQKASKLFEEFCTQMTQEVLLPREGGNVNEPDRTTGDDIDTKGAS